MYLSVALFLRVFLPLVGLPHGVARMTTARSAAFAAAVRVIDRVHGDAATVGRTPSQRVRPALAIEMLP
jgi:hypothetical protein